MWACGCSVLIAETMEDYAKRNVGRNQAQQGYGMGPERVLLIRTKPERAISGKDILIREYNIKG